MADAVALPEPPAPRGRYAAAVAHGGVVVTAGMTPRRDGELVVRGVVGADLGVGEAAEAAGLAARNALAAAASGAGGLDGIARVVAMTVYVACAEGFTRLSAVADGASDAIVETLGTEGRASMARAAVGVRALPDGAPVEVQLTVGCKAPGGTHEGQSARQRSDGKPHRPGSDREGERR